MRLNGNDPERWEAETTDDGFVSDALGSLDPASWDPMYWFRFHRDVVRSAARELARRRAEARLTVEDVLTSWSRALIPAAAAAAALAGFLLLRSPKPLETMADIPVGIEELLHEGLEGAPIPAVLGNLSSVGTTVSFSDADAY